MPGELGRSRLALRNRPSSAPAFWAVGALVAFCIALYVGSGDVQWTHLFRSGPSLSKTLFWQLRLPRVVAAAAVGGGLALVGAILQSSLRNPLADPFLLGVSSASATGAVAALALGIQTGRFGLSVLAALASLLVLDRLAFRKGVFSNHTLLIAGVALTYLLSAATGLVIALSDATKTRGLVFWLMGGFSSVDPLSSSICCAILLLSCAYLYRFRSELDILATGDESAHVLGVRPDKLRRKLFFVCSLVVGASVATAGGIGFVGILVPHLARFYCGVSHRQLLPLCVLGGAGLTLMADTFCRTVISPREIPVGLVTALLGAPFFLRQLHKGGGW